MNIDKTTQQTTDKAGSIAVPQPDHGELDDRQLQDVAGGVAKSPIPTTSGNEAGTTKGTSSSTIYK